MTYSGLTHNQNLLIEPTSVIVIIRSKLFFSFSFLAGGGSGLKLSPSSQTHEVNKITMAVSQQVRPQRDEPVLGQLQVAQVP